MTTIYLIHHAPAAPRAGDAPLELGDEGRRVAGAVAAAMGEKLRAGGVVLDAILTSPEPCAADTAAALAAAVPFEGAVEAVRALLPGVPPHVATRAIGGRGAHVAVVGHDPALTAMAGIITALPRYLTFKPGLVLAIEGTQPVWKIDPQTAQVIPVMLERK